MAEEREEISCECQEIHEDLLKIVNETMPDEEERGIVAKAVPMSISEAEPRDLGGKK